MKVHYYLEEIPFAWKYKDYASFDILYRVENKVEVSKMVIPLWARLPAEMEEELEVSFKGQREFVLKIVHLEEGNSEQRMRMEREYEYLIKLSEVCKVVRAYEGNIVGDKYCIIMEYWGRSLYEEAGLKHKGAIFRRIPTQTVGDWLLQILHILQVLESNKQYHGDIKPHNILIKEKEIKLADFGVSGVVDKTHQLRYGLYKADFDQIFKGCTWEYCPPELIHRKPPYYVNKIDMYSIGLSFMQILCQISNSELYHLNLNYPHKHIKQSLRDKLAAIPDQSPFLDKLSAILFSCLKKNPKKRPPYQLLIDLLTDIDTLSLVSVCSELRIQGICECSGSGSGSAERMYSSIIISKERYEEEGNPKLESMLCIECEGIARAPVTKCTLCNHYFCGECAEQLLAKNMNCPFGCTRSMSTSLLTPEEQNITAHLLIKCRYHKNGCPLIMHAYKIIIHESQCSFTTTLTLFDNYFNFTWKFHYDNATEMKRSGNWKEARDQYIKALEGKLSNSRGEGCMEIANIYLKLGQLYISRLDRPDNALDIFNLALKIRIDIYGEDHLETITVYIEIAGVYSYLQHYDKALNCYHKCIGLININYKANNLISTRLKEVEAIVYTNMAQIYKKRGEYQKALALFQDCMQILGSKNTMKLAKIYDNIGVLYKMKDELRVATEYFEKVLKICEELGEGTSITAGNALNNMGLVELEQNNYMKAIELFHKSINIQKECGSPNKERKTMILKVNNRRTIIGGINIGIAYKQLGNLEKGEEWFKKAKQTSNEELGNKDLLEADCAYQLGQIELLKLQTNMAAKLFREFLDIKQKHLPKDSREIAIAYMKYAQTNININPKEAKKYLQISLNIFLANHDNINIKNVRNLLHSLGEYQ